MQHAKSSESVGPGEIYLCFSFAKKPSEGGAERDTHKERERELICVYCMGERVGGGGQERLSRAASLARLALYAYMYA